MITRRRVAQNRMNPAERQFNTDVKPADEVVMISRDTAYIDDNGQIVQQNYRPSSHGTLGLFEHLHRQHLSRHHVLGERF